LSVDTGVVDPILLVHGVTGLEPGAITSAAITGPENPRPGDRLTIDLGTHHYRIAFDADDARGTNMRVSLSDETRSQLLWSQQGEGDEPHWFVIWAGDLDHDGELDLLVDFSEKYSAFNSILFLSSRAKGGDMVGQAAHFNHAGC